MNTDFENRAYPKNAAEASELWRKQIKYDLLLQKAADTEIEEARKKLHRRYDTYAENRKQMDGNELLEIYLNALTSSYDPHTSYLSPTTLENFVIAMRLQVEGIGAALQMLDGHTVISKVIPGGAADKDGRLKPEDHIIGVGQGVDGEIEKLRPRQAYLTHICHDLEHEKTEADLPDGVALAFDGLRIPLN